MALAALPHALGLNAASVIPQPVSLFIQQQRSFSGGDFHVKDSFGREVVYCTGKTFSAQQQTKFFPPGTPEGSPPMFVLKKHRIVILSLYKFYIEDANGQEVVQLNRKFHIGGMKFKITFNNTAHDGQPVELLLSGSLFEHRAVITWNGTPVAHVQKKLNAGSLVGKDRYSMDLAPGCDVVLFAAMTVCLDEAYRDSDRSYDRLS